MGIWSEIGRLKTKLKYNKNSSFHRLPYKNRVLLVKQNYSHKSMVASFDRYFAVPQDTRQFRSPFYDVISGYVHILQPNCVQQVGCFTAMESRWLIDTGFGGKVIASDFDPKRLSYLEEKFAGTAYERIELRHLDLESRDYRALQGSEVVVANAVFSNLQPETVDYFISRMAANGISLLIVADIITKESLSLSSENTPSLASAIDRNWYHRYIALANKHSIKAIILPEFITALQGHSYSIFILHVGLPQAMHHAAISAAFKSYVDRQELILRSLEKAER